ncbi:MAG TPA: hypothetical protein VML58_06345, partial [Burkholderiaceae bacterium]|nr:hypothetical protein [Burkholderiaceae bacterium]
MLIRRATPGFAEQIPVAACDGGLIAHRECRQHAGHAGIADAQQQGIAHGLACVLDRPRSGVGKLARLWTGHRAAHRAGG